MSNLPISGLTEGTVVDINNDFLVYVDSSDTTQNLLTGSTKKLKPANLPISTPTQAALDGKQAAGDYATNTALTNGLSTKENTITAGATSQYYRGDKTFQTLDKIAVGLSNVDNTSDANKPVSTATQTALNAKENTLNADQKRKITISTSAPTGGADGDVWFQYTP